MKFISKTFYISLVSITLIEASDPNQGAHDVVQQDSKYPTLSQVLNNTAINGVSEDDWELVDRSKRQYTEWKGVKWMDNCQSSCSGVLSSDLGSNPFCSLLFSSIDRKSRKALSENRLKKRRDIRDATRYFKLGKLGSLSEYSEADLIQSLKGVSKLRQIRSSLDQALHVKQCMVAPIYTALGLRVEGEFPNPEYKEMAMQLYSKAIECGDSVNSAQAAYRLGLMQIWEQRCDRAEETLSKIGDSDQSSEYRMRAGYWRTYCAEQLNNLELRKTLVEWVLKEYPLSLHALILRSPTFLNESSESGDPEIQFRASVDHDLSDVTRAVELLLENGEKKPAISLLEANLSKVLKSESSFQLYWAVLLKRAGIELSSFQIIANIFRLNSKMISKETLKLMYPIRQLKLIEELNLSQDPYLILSIMRQESAFNERARSPTGALGLMQVELRTARLMRRVNKKQLVDPKVNIQIGVKYLNFLIRSHKGEVELALAAYNAGPERVKQWLKRYPIDGNMLLFLDLLPIRETREYVSSIIRNYYLYLKIYRDKSDQSEVRSPTQISLFPKSE